MLDTEYLPAYKRDKKRHEQKEAKQGRGEDVARQWFCMDPGGQASARTEFFAGAGIDPGLQAAGSASSGTR